MDVFEMFHFNRTKVKATTCLVCIELIVENFDHWIFRLQQFWMISFTGKRNNFGGRKIIRR